MTDNAPILRWTHEEVWLMAGIARRSLAANAPFTIEVIAGADELVLALSFDADLVKLALGARDSTGQRWRDGWLLELERGAERWSLDGGGEIEIANARSAPVVCRLRVRRRWISAPILDEQVPLTDVAFHRYTRQSTSIGTSSGDDVPWMTPTRAESAPWWEIDLGKPMCVVWMRVDLAPLPAATRITVHAYG
ncbi:MAG TPA: hypothetical protein VK427_14610, partial [Kofleriaceae bacterium]|nr:hypothetical protein [Kofleriaceae bacterium]